jgi:membrane protease YdiL (CAAX protease family)
VRLLPFAVVYAVTVAVWHPAWAGWSAGWLGVQLAFGVVGSAALFGGALAVQVALTRRRRALRVPATASDLWLQVAFYALNGPLEEAFFRGLVQGGLGALTVPAAGFAVATTAYVLYHRLGGWAWPDVFATALLGVPLGLAYLLLPGQSSILGVSIAHVGGTCGYLGVGPWLLRRSGRLG